jgi:hypothetical protein
MPSPSTSSNEALLKLSERGHLLVTRDQGEPLRQELLELLSKHQSVVVDLDGVEAYTPSFIDEVLGKCLAAIGPDQFRRRIKLVSSTPEVRKLTNLVLSNRSAKRPLGADA